MKNKLSQGFTLIELLVVITIIAILAGAALPTFSRIQERGQITKGISNCKQIITALRIYSSDNNGLYPDAEENTSANDAFKLLFEEEILDNETVFGCPISSVGNPDGIVGPPPYAQALEGGENHWMMTGGASDTASGSLPLVFENAQSATWNPSWDPTAAGTTAPGRSWKGGKVIIGLNDSSVSTYDLDSKTTAGPLKGGSDNLFARHTGAFTVLDVIK